MSRDSESRTVTTRFVWLPHGSAAGWLLLHRTVQGHGLDTDEFWRSERIPPGVTLSGTLPDSAPEWRRLVTGAPVPFLLWPFFLAAVTDRELPTVHEQIVRSLIRPIAEISAEVDGAAGGATAPRLALAHDPFGPDPANLELGEGWSVAPLGPEGRREALLAAVAARLPPAGIADSTGPVLVHRFAASPYPPESSPAGLGEVLAREPVRRAVAGLLADPTAADPRRMVEAVVQEHGWLLRPEPLPLTPGQPARGFLGRLVLFCDEDSTLHRIATTPACADVLRRRDGLAADVARHLCPLDPVDDADGAFQAVLRDLPAEWDTALPGTPGLGPPAWDEITTITRDDSAPGGHGLPRQRGPVEISHVELVDSNGRHSWRIDLTTPHRTGHQSGGADGS
ncbi:hypothetical protein [Actinoplanes sp. NPDC051859]|uniref:hypothetical protein n=1 Tax=Actinoplanes sp. NPDC051859 TaxID=3363909 RepID=UPI0037B1650A